MSEYTSPVEFIDLESQQKLIRTEIETAIQNVLDHGQYIMGPEVKNFELNLREYTKSKHALTCANGTDALSIVMMAWGIGPGDAVFVPSFTYVASAESPAQLGATPFFVDVDRETFNIDSQSFKQAIIDCKNMGLRPAAVVVVDLFGQPGDVDSISEIANLEDIKVLVDGAQSFGAISKDRIVGCMGDATTTSFFPAKPLGCYGDGGAIFTQNDELAEIINSIRLHGKGKEKYDNIRVGLNSRLDTFQAAILIEKLKIFPEELLLRQKVADNYSSQLSGIFITPKVLKNYTSSWAQYTLVMNKRDYMQVKLKEKGIPSIVYYPKALSQQDGYKHFPRVSSGLKNSEELSSKVLSLPMFPYLSDDKQNRIIQALLDLK